MTSYDPHKEEQPSRPLQKYAANSTARKREAERCTPHEFVGNGGACLRCGGWDLNGIHTTSPQSDD